MELTPLEAKVRKILEQIEGGGWGRMATQTQKSN